MEMREETIKAMYVDNVLVGFFKQNGTLKVYKVEEVSYGEIDRLFDAKAAI